MADPQSGNFFPASRYVCPFFPFPEAQQGLNPRRLAVGTDGARKNRHLPVVRMWCHGRCASASASGQRRTQVADDDPRNGLPRTSTQDACAARGRRVVSASPERAGDGSPAFSFATDRCAASALAYFPRRKIFVESFVAHEVSAGFDKGLRKFAGARSTVAPWPYFFWTGNVAGDSSANSFHRASISFESGIPEWTNNP